LTGASPSVVRAALMAAAMLIGRLGGSRAHATSALGLAALVMLLAAPSVLWDVGFQLSLLATAGLIWFGRWFERRLDSWPGWIREPVALTMAAQLTTLPVILVNFERLSLVAPIANVLVVPLVPLAMLFSALTAMGGAVLSALPLGPMGDAIGWFLGGSSWLVLLAMISVGHLVASVPLAAVDVSIPGPIAIAWLPILALASWAMRDATPTEEPSKVPDEAMTGAMAGLARLVHPLPAAGLLVAVLLIVTVAGRPDGRLHVTTLDIGQGDAILVQAPDGATMLVDGGPDPELTLRRLGANLGYPERRLDLLVLSHPHQDHVAGLIEVLDRFEVGAVLHAGIAFQNTANERLVADATATGVPLTLARTGQIWQLGVATTVEVLYPTDADAAAPLPEGDINNGSVVLVVRHGGFTALLTGDAEEPVESMLISRGLLAPVDLLKVGHHGSHSSTSPELLESTRPTVATISSGEGNEYGHPASETLAALAAHPEITVLRTDTDGDIEVVSDGSSYQVRTDHGLSASRPVHGAARTGSIGPWPFPTDPAPGACSTSRTCPMGSSFIPRALLGLPWPPLSSWRAQASRSTSRWSKRRPCCTTSTRSRSVAPGASTASSAHAAWRNSATRSSPCRSPPIRSPPCWTTSAFRSAGHPSWWPWRTGTWPRHS
nr:ComEC/Rec2 family competence protein [Chloroflexota bacterium]